MSKKNPYPIRLATNRTPHGTEWIEQAENGVLWWKADHDDIFLAFPCPLEAAKEYFVEWGRELDPSRLPIRPTANPYATYK